MRISIILLFSFIAFASLAQTASYKWFNPATNSFPVIEGQAWPKEVAAPYDRFPARAGKTLNPNVWNLSHSSAGLYIKFKTNANAIKVRYVVKNKGSFAMNHMPATGVSGVDLYAIDHSGNWVWASGRYSFADTVEYHYQNLEVDHVFTGKDCEYRLFLPLYNEVSWMEIGVPQQSSFIPMPLSLEKPVVIYGTSIAQGGCATRTGLAWTSILQRSLDRPVVNLGFSGTGRLEQSVLDLMNEIDAKIYILDCLPNLTAGAGFTDEEVEKRINAAVKQLQQKHPAIPILLAEHCCGNNRSVIDTARYNEFERVNNILRKTFAKMLSAGIKNIYTLTNKEIGFDINSTVDGVHPDDIGMMKYATAYEKVIRSIISEPVDSFTTTIPVVQNRDGFYDWRIRHAEILALNKTSAPQNIILANSIIHCWSGLPKASIERGKASWDKYLEPLGVRNFGFGWDRIENLLWRVYHEELDGFDAKHIVLMVGTNNLEFNTDKEIIAGLKLLIQQIKIRQPNAALLISGILPRRKLEQRIVSINNKISTLAVQSHITYINPGKVLLDSKGKIDESLVIDGLHPNEAGYTKLGIQLEGYLK